MEMQKNKAKNANRNSKIEKTEHRKMDKLKRTEKR